MLWYKSWLETRWRFVIGLAILILSATGTVLAYPRVVRLLPLVPSIDASGEVGRRIMEIADAVADLPRLRLGAVAAPEHDADAGALRGAARHRRTALAGVGRRRAVHALAAGVARPAARRPRRDRAGGAARARLPAVAACCRCSRRPSARRFGVGDVLVHGACVFVAGAVLFSMASLLSTVFSDVWRPALIVCAARRLRSAIAEPFFGDYSRYSLFGHHGRRDVLPRRLDCRGWDCSPARPCRRRCCSPRAETSRARISDAPHKENAQMRTVTRLSSPPRC